MRSDAPVIGTLVDPAPDGDAPDDATRLVLGVIGKSWLTFLLGAITITVVRSVIGW